MARFILLAILCFNALHICAQENPDSAYNHWPSNSENCKPYGLHCDSVVAVNFGWSSAHDTIILLNETDSSLVFRISSTFSGWVFQCVFDVDSEHVLRISIVNWVAEIDYAHSAVAYFSKRGISSSEQINGIGFSGETNYVKIDRIIDADKVKKDHPIQVLDSSLIVTEYTRTIAGVNSRFPTEIKTVTDSTITFQYFINVDWCQDPQFRFTFEVDSADILRITVHRLDQDFQICQGDNIHSFTVTCKKTGLLMPEIKGVGFANETAFVPVTDEKEK